MIQALLSELWPYLVGLVSIIAGLFYARQSGKRSGRQEAEAQQLKQTLQGVEDARNARTEIDALSDDAVRNRARERMRQQQGPG